MGFGGKLEKMTLSAYVDGGEHGRALRTVQVLINPESYRRQFRVVLDDEATPGSGYASPVFDHTEAETLSFQLVFDATGVLPTALSGFVPSLADGIDKEIEAFKAVALTFNGKIHSPNHVSVNWGSAMEFKGLLTDLDIDYTLFKPDGSALRAKVDCTFRGYTTPADARVLENKRSPDLTHVAVVEEGETLPFLCDRFYGDPQRYAQVARANGLASFRALKPGLRLVFPPLAAMG